MRELILRKIESLRQGDVVYGQDAVSAIGTVLAIESRRGGWYKVTLNDAVTLLYRSSSAVWVERKTKQ